MSDGVKLGMTAVICFTLFFIGVLVADHLSKSQQMELRQAACVNPDSVACALAVRR
jgi:hypothetical protein